MVALTFGYCCDKLPHTWFITLHTVLQVGNQERASLGCHPDVDRAAFLLRGKKRSYFLGFSSFYRLPMSLGSP